MDCRLFAVVFALSAVGCFTDAQPSTDDDVGSTGNATSGSTSTGEAPESTGELDTSSGVVDPTVDGSSSSTSACELVTVPVPVAAVDIAMVLDSSSAMLDNAQEVQTALDGISDVFPENELHRFILMSPLETENNVDFCMPPPLGGPICGVDRIPHFTHVDVDTRQATADPLGEMITALGMGVQSIRPASQKHRVVVTDGDVLATPDALAGAIRELGPEFIHARVHGISGGRAGGCEDDMRLDALVTLLGGQSVDLCPLEGSPELFGTLLEPRPSCIVDVNVEGDIEGALLVSGEQEIELAYVDSLDDCSPTQPAATILEGALFLCPRTCRDFQDTVAANPAELELFVCE